MTDVSERAQAVARALCAADGKNPATGTLRSATHAAGLDTFAGDLAQEGPQLWEVYVVNAERFVVAIEAVVDAGVPGGASRVS